MMTPQKLAPYILRHLAASQRAGRASSLQTITLALKVRRVDVRQAISALHGEGLLDALTLRLSLRGFALGVALRHAHLAPVRLASRAEATVAA